MDAGLNVVAIKEEHLKELLDLDTVSIDSVFLDENEVAQILSISVATLRSRRSRGHNFPPFIKRGRKVIFDKVSLYRWLKEGETQEIHTSRKQWKRQK